MSEARPLVGVTSYLEPARMGVWDVTAVFLPHAYVRPLVAAGAAVVVLPPQENAAESAATVVAALDGLVVAGGYDVEPQRYGATPHASTDAPRADRDAWELALLVAAAARDLPTLGICRGAQLLNVARGGSLHQHLPDLVGSTRHQGKDGVFATLPVETVPGTKVAELHHATRDVPVYHHQAIDRLGEGLVVSAVSDDGIVEAIEDPSLSFCVATQWHPEQDADASTLFGGFIAEARAARATRHGG